MLEYLQEGQQFLKSLKYCTFYTLANIQQCCCPSPRWYESGTARRAILHPR